MCSWGVLTKKVQENDLKSNFIKMIKAFEEETDKPLKELQANTIKLAKERNKTVQDLNVEIKAINTD